MDSVDSGAVTRFAEDCPIEINYSGSRKFWKTTRYDPYLLAQKNVWHEVVVRHRGVGVDGDVDVDVDGTNELVDAIVDAVKGEEIYMVAYRRGKLEDRFLVRDCAVSLEKLFERNLEIPFRRGSVLPVTVFMNVAACAGGHIAPHQKLTQALNRCFRQMPSDGVMNLSRFHESEEFYNLIVHLGSRGVLKRVCEIIYSNDEYYRTINGFNLRRNKIKTLVAMQIFGRVKYTVLDLRDNNIHSAAHFCAEMRFLKADDLLLAGNPLCKSKSYPYSLQTILKNFKRLDGIPTDFLSQEFNPLDCETTMQGYRIDATNIKDLEQFANSNDWHAVKIVDPEGTLTKGDIFMGIFRCVSSSLPTLYPCYYRFKHGEHAFLVHNCLPQLEHLVYECNLLESLNGSDNCVVPRPTYLCMNARKYEKGQVEPTKAIESALKDRWNNDDGMLDLHNFQNSKRLQNIVIDMNSKQFVKNLLLSVATKNPSRCTALRLAQNNIYKLSISSFLPVIKTLKMLDLSDNELRCLDDIRELKLLKFVSLRLAGNPLCAVYRNFNLYANAVRDNFTGLCELDGKDISKKNIWKQQHFLCDLALYPFVDEFLKRFYATYDSRMRTNMKGLYHPNALFTMNLSDGIRNSPVISSERIAKYLQYSRNLLKFTELAKCSKYVLVGPDAIMQLYARLPRVLHDMTSFTTDTTVFGKKFIKITVSGLFSDGGDHIVNNNLIMAFTRTFILRAVEHAVGFLQGATVYQIVNEQFSIYTPTQNDHFQYKSLKTVAKSSPSPTLADQNALVIMMQEVIGLKSIWCSRYLQNAEWDLKQALVLFEKDCASGKIPDTSFK